MRSQGNGLARLARPTGVSVFRTLAAIVALTCCCSTLLAAEQLRVIVETDAGGDPDDEQSLVRFLLYANEWDVEGIIANRAVARDGENRNARAHRPGHRPADAQSV